MVADDPLHEIRLRAWQRNRTRAGDLAAVIARSRRAGTMTSADRTHARALTHQLIGSTGTFGHDTVSQILGRVRQLLDDRPAPGAQITDDLDELHEVVERANQLLGQHPSGDDD